MLADVQRFVALEQELETYHVAMPFRPAPMQFDVQDIVKMGEVRNLAFCARGGGGGGDSWFTIRQLLLKCSLGLSVARVVWCLAC